ncbi:A/G-specific adenine glycosylase [Psychrobacter sp. FDAARGOS_221]|uniref:A/G-specific adenine glycosylase n=1 Tax=Psychrobacter sp. FDAARGOS_221 TaxID=1975705 RepID=UPI000BB57153|nr:A/G-specific adenine glycosylase [Psychrobacter sp. FDAARGOS_221]PNK60566.1 A/G-specific adenine glycosylase [Psychrobacter sp. FDAARGOS_221]
MSKLFNHTEAELNAFAPRILDWFDSNGRHDLPWQQHKTDTPNPYIVWLSEVMLQQTQVTTVIPYFHRFMDSFPTVQDLANADWDMVAEHWAGLGYYARARNLHKGAKQLVEIINETGDFPQTVAGWEAISGVGPSTAGAIVAMGLHGYGVICDGNVKRVLTRWAGIDGDITKSATNKQLWALAERLTPEDDSGHYAQAMMDMGATLCTRRNPNCEACPISQDCIAHAQGREMDYPYKAKKKPKPSKFSNTLLMTNPQGELLWLQRHDSGIWGGLWVLPLQFEKKMQGKTVVSTASEDDAFESENSVAEQIVAAWLESANVTLEPIQDGLLESAPIKHTLTHFHWYLQPQKVHLTGSQATELTKKLQDAEIELTWLSADEAKATLGLPKAMLKVLETLSSAQ